MKLDYGSLFVRAWQLTWRHKVLWIFGILAGLGGAPSSPGDGGNNSGGGSSSGGSLPWPPEIQRFVDRLDQNTLIALGLGLACLALIVGVVLIALQVIGRGGLIGGVRLAAASGNVTFGEAWQVGLQKFWTLFLIGLSVGVVTLIAALTILIPGIFLAVATLGLGLLCLIPLFCLLAIAATLLGIIAYFAQIAAVVENLGVMDAFRRAWDVITANLGDIVLVGVILMVISLIAGFALALPFFFLALPLIVGMAGLASDSQAISAGSLAFGLICCAAYLPVLLVLNGILQTWQTAVWTLAYGQLTGAAHPGAPSAPQVLA